MERIDHLIELGEGECDQPLVGQTEALEHDHLVLGREHLEQAVEALDRLASKTISKLSG